MILMTVPCSFSSSAAVNGYMYGNLPGLIMCQGDNVSWHLLGLGTEVDIHSVLFQGNILNYAGTKREIFTVFPHSTLTVTMQAHNAGNCQIFSLSKMQNYFYPVESFLYKKIVVKM